MKTAGLFPVKNDRGPTLSPTPYLVSATDKTSFHFLTIHRQRDPGRMWGIDCAEHDAVSVITERGKPPWLDTEWSSGVHFLATSSEIAGFVVLSAAAMYLRFHDRLRKPRMRAATK